VLIGGLIEKCGSLAIQRTCCFDGSKSDLFKTERDVSLHVLQLLALTGCSVLTCFLLHIPSSGAILLSTAVHYEHENMSPGCIPSPVFKLYYIPHTSRYILPLKSCPIVHALGYGNSAV
jgi:hypothetical protein